MGLNAVRTTIRTSWLLFACMCVPLHSSAQSQQSSYEVSVRELRIPPKAHQNFEQGMKCLAKKDAAGSLPHFQRAIAEFAGYYEAYDRMGAAFLKLWRVPEAEQAFRKSIELSGGGYAHPLLALGAILDDQGKFDEALTVVRKGLDLNPESWTGYYYQGLALFGSNRLEEAEKSAHEVLLRKTEFPKAHLLLADIHSRQKQYASLVIDLDEYLRLVPDGPDSDWAKALLKSVQGMMFESQSSIPNAQP